MTMPMAVCQWQKSSLRNINQLLRYLMNILRRYISVLYLLIMSVCRVLAQDAVYTPLDSTYMKELEDMMIQVEKEQKVRDIIKSYDDAMLRHEMEFHWDGFTELVRGGIDSWRRNGFYKTETVWPRRGNNILDYGVAVSPLALTWGMKLAGVQPASTTRRMVVSNALAMGLSIGLSTEMKQIVDQRRPDGKDNRSMPSRHAAVAFACATILHREYGQLSPWFSIGGYSAATATEFFRLHNNAHWAKDVYVGAGIGMVSTNLAYFITDRIFGAKGIHKPHMTMDDIRRLMQYGSEPSSLSLVSGVEWGSNRDGDVVYGTTFSAGLEYSHFLNSEFAVELMGRTGTTEAYSRDDPMHGFNIDTYHMDVAAKYSHLTIPTMRVAGRLFGGTRLLISTLGDASGKWCGECGAGFSVNYFDTEKYSVGMSCDYVHAFSSRMRDRWVVNACWNIIL